MYPLSRTRVVLMTAALTIASFAIPVASPAAVPPHPVKSNVTRLALTAASRAQTARPSAADLAEAQKRANGRRGQVSSASPVIAVPSDLVVIGLTWARGTGAGSTVQYRQRVKSGWSSWAFIDTDGNDGPDHVERSKVSMRSGSAPVVVTGASHLQVRLITPDKGVSPASPEIVVVDPGTSDADRSIAVTAKGALPAATSRPVVLTRAQWGADESLRDQSAPRYGAVNAAFVHHTAGSNSYTSDQVPSVLRGIYAFHVSGQGWRDIGYNFLVDRFGRTWEGRYGGTTRPVVGAQASGMNDDSFGVSVLGSFDLVGVPTAAVSAVRTLIGWKAQIHEFNPVGTALINGVKYNAVSGHRNANQTSCPGSSLYAQVPSIRTAAGAMVKGLPSLSVDRDLDNREGGDLLVRRSNGELALYSTTNSGALTSPAVVGKVTDRDLLTIAGDFDGGGSADLISRRPSDGALLLQVGDATGNGQPGPARVINAGWSIMDVITGAGDWDGDGRQDLLARVKGTGELRLYPGNGKGGFGRARTFNYGWQGMRLVTGVGDWDADGHPDVLAVTTTGQARIYQGNGVGSFKAVLTLSGDWSGYRSVVGVGDATGDTRVNIIAVTPNGTAQLGRVGSSASSVSWSTLPTSLSGLAVYPG